MEAVSAKGARAYIVQRAQELVVPIGVHVDVTYRCDLDCVHCYLAERDKDDLTLEDYERLFDELRELGTLFLLVSGGEIFHRPDGFAILEAARKRRFEVRIITHGGHIDEALAGELGRIGIAVAAMSIYAAEPGVHDAVTKVPGSWARTVAAAEHLRDAGVPVLLKCVLMAPNPDVVAELKALATRVGAGIEFQFNIRGANDGSDSLLELNLDLEARAAVADCVYPELVDGQALPAFSPDRHTCLAGNASCYVGPDGTVQPCLEWEEPAGSIRAQSFKEIWLDSPVFRRARLIRRSSFEGCTPCENHSHCSLCPAKSHRETGSPTGTAPSKCRETMAKTLLLGEEAP